MKTIFILKRFYQFLMLITIVIFLSNCIGSNSKWIAIKVESTPQGAAVKNKLNYDLGLTPTIPQAFYRKTVGTLPGLREIKDELTITKEGYKETKIIINIDDYKYNSEEEAFKNVKVISVILEPIEKKDSLK